MPDIGASVGHSVTAGFPSVATGLEQKDVIRHLFEAVESFNWLEKEDDLHLVTCLSGSGPAYYFAFCETMIAAAIKAGLNDDLAKNLCVGTAVCSR